MRLFKSEKKELFSSFIPENQRVYAVGDIHGRHDLLSLIHQQVLADAKDFKGTKTIVYLGDYIDRGMESFQVLETLINQPLKGFEAVHLMGNHEQSALFFMNNPEVGATWLMWGGEEALMSYGIETMDANGQRHTPSRLAEALRDRMPESHFNFLQSLKIYEQIGDYMFAHAGVKPGVPLEKQQERDMLTIRDEFHSHPSPFDKRVVFGHTVFEAPLVDEWRIGIDTGAYATGVLTAAVLEGDEVRFLQTQP